MRVLAVARAAMRRFSAAGAQLRRGSLVRVPTCQRRLCAPGKNHAGLDLPALLQNSPTIRPSSSTSILTAAGSFGSPGMVMMSPQTITTNSAPAASRTSRTLTT